MADLTHPYQRLQAELAILIRNTTPGERLPSEPHLAKQMGVSRATLREAMRSFEGKGLIRRRQGIGTFVVGPARVIETGLEVLQSIESLADEIGLNVSMGDLRIYQIKANETQAKKMATSLEKPLVKIERTITADGRPVAFLVDILPEDILNPADLEVGFTGSVLDLLMRRGSPQLAHSLTDIQAVAAVSEVARALEIQRGDVLLFFEARLFDIAGKVVDLSESYFLPGYFHFHVVRSIG